MPAPAWLRRIRRRSLPQVARLARALGYDVVLRTPYSPIADVPPADSPEWQRTTPLLGPRLDLDLQLARLEGPLAPFLAELAPPAGPPVGFRLDNGYFAGLDALLLWATLRELRPRRVLELGAGHSTLLTLGALDANGAGELASFDPDPRLPADSLAHPRLRLERSSARDVPVERFLELAAGDVLFLDTTHTVKRGSEVNRIVLEILPRLAAGVVVHVHDVFLPWDYPRDWYARGTHVAEQYLLAAYLTENPRWEIVAAAHALFRAHAARLRRLAPGVELLPRPSHGAASFWLRRLPAVDDGASLGTAAAC